jgi:hypothetical protein
VRRLSMNKSNDCLNFLHSSLKLVI